MSTKAPPSQLPSHEPEMTAHQFSPLPKAPAYLKVYEAIETEILSGNLKEGAIIPTEASLCEQFGVTRSTVREGIRLLETSGLVSRGAGKRLIVKRPDTDDVALSTSRALTFSGITFREAWESLSLFQPELAAMAAKKISGRNIEQLKYINKNLNAVSSKDYEQIVSYTDEFFNVLAASVENSVTMALSLSLNRLIKASLTHVISNVDDARSRITKAQSALIDALEKKDDTLARQWMARHIDDLQRGYEVAGLDMEAPIV